MARKIVVTISVVWAWLAATVTLLYWSNTTANWTSSAIGATVNTVTQWVALAGNWMVQLLW